MLTSEELHKRSMELSEKMDKIHIYLEKRTKVENKSMELMKQGKWKESQELLKTID